MKIKYTGPADAVNVKGYGLQKQGEVKEYPDDFGADLISTSVKQKFEVVADTTADISPESLTVEQLKADLALFMDAAALKGKKKDELVTLWKSIRDNLETQTVG